MKDQFEKFVEDRRSELDVFEPRDGLWDAVNEKLHKPKNYKRYWYYRIAASVLLLMGALVWLVPGTKQKNISTETVIINPEERKAEVYYASLIEAKRNELNKYCKQQPELCDEFGKELDTLNVMYTQLKKEYSGSVNNEVVLNAMINNLQLQLQVLSQQLHIIQSMHSKEDSTKAI